MLTHDRGVVGMASSLHSHESVRRPERQRMNCSSTTDYVHTRQEVLVVPGPGAHRLLELTHTYVIITQRHCAAQLARRATTELRPGGMTWHWPTGSVKKTYLPSFK